MQQHRADTRSIEHISCYNDDDANQMLWQNKQERHAIAIKEREEEFLD